MKCYRLIPLLVCVCMSVQSFSQPGTIDSSFGSNGRATSQLGNNYHSFSRSIAVQKDGKIVLCGDSLSGSVYSFGLSRFNADGSRDRSFGKKGSVNTPMPPGRSSSLNAITLQQDGKIITGAYSVGDYNFYLFRYLPGGKLDTSFGKNGMATVSIGPGGEIFLSQIVVQDDGKIVAAGNNDGFLITRCLPNGNMDSSFGVNGILTTREGDYRFVDEVISLPGGGLYVATTSFPEVSDYRQFELDRLLPNGDKDESFGYFGAAKFSIYGSLGHDFATGIALLPDGSILEAGTTDAGNAILKCKPDGSLDPSFGSNGIVTNVSPSHSFARVLVQPDGKIIVADSYLTRLMPNGKPDSSFGVNGRVFSSDQFESAILLSNGKILTHATPYSIITRYLGDAEVSVKKDISVKEGNSGTTPATFTVLLGKAATDTVKVGYTTTGITATEGKDYTAASGTLVFTPGTTSRTIIVSIIGDKQAESNETFALQLQNPVHGVLGAKPSGTCTITNDDGRAFAPDAKAMDEKPAVAYAKVSLFPNPAGDYITLTGLQINGKSVVRIMDAGGRQVLEQVAAGSQCRIQVNALPAGIYYVTILAHPGYRLRRNKAIRDCCLRQEVFAGESYLLHP